MLKRNVTVFLDDNGDWQYHFSDDLQLKFVWSEFNSIVNDQVIRCWCQLGQVPLNAHHIG